MNGTDARGGAVVVMNIKTGEVLAMASYPGYDPETSMKCITSCGRTNTIP